MWQVQEDEENSGLSLAQLTARRRSRGNYRCSKCGEPKKGHVCAYQPMRSKTAQDGGR
jgi:hypothetical protein